MSKLLVAVVNTLLIEVIYCYSWKAWSSQRVLSLWGHFLRSPESNLDPQIATIKGIYEKISALAK
jgi:hypothetical protein